MNTCLSTGVIMACKSVRLTVLTCTELLTGDANAWAAWEERPHRKRERIEDCV